MKSHLLCARNPEKKSRKSLLRLLNSLVTVGMFVPFPLLAATYTVTTFDDPPVAPNGTIAGGGVSLRSAILQANVSGALHGTVGGSNTIKFSPLVFTGPQTINLTRELPLIFSNVDIQGPASVVTVDGGAARRGLFISGLPALADPNGPPQPITVNISNMTLENMRAEGGDGGIGSGGGGMGAGGALFVNSNATVTISNMTFSNNQAIGGDGAIPSFAGIPGGGGGLGGNGGDADAVNINTGGGGGLGGSGSIAGGGIGGDGGANDAGDSAGGGGFGGNGIGQILNTQGFASAGSGDGGALGGTKGGGGGGGYGGTAGASGDTTGLGGNSGPYLNSSGGGGGISGGNGGVGVAGNGGIGGGGGRSTGGGGAGGFGGGGGNDAGGFGAGGGGNAHAGGFGGGGSGGYLIAGGTGGFGGGGGGGNLAGISGFGGGNGAAGGGGGGGAAMGGGIFVAQGGLLRIQGNGNLSGSTLTGGDGNGGGDGQAFGRAIFLQGNGGTLTFDPGRGNLQVCHDEIADQTGVGGVGPNAGSWNLTKEGAGTLSVPAAVTHLYSGRTSVNQGVLLLNGRLPNSAVFVNSGATLKGNGSMKSLDLRGGTVSPGNSIGTLTVAGDYTMDAASTYIAEVSGNGTSDLIKVTMGGTAHVDGTLKAEIEPGSTLQSLKGQTYTILKAEGVVTGKFAQDSTVRRIHRTVTYTPNAVLLSLSNFQDFADAFSPNDTCNAAKMARYLDTFVNNTPVGGDFSTVLQVLDGYLTTEDGSSLQVAHNQMQPSLFREFGFLSFSQGALVSKSVSAQQQYRREGIWGNANKLSMDGISPARLAAFQQLVNTQPGKGFVGQANKGNAPSQPHKRGLSLQNEGRAKGAPAVQRVGNELTSVWIQPYGQLNKKSHNSGGAGCGNVGIKSETYGMSIGGDIRVMPNTFVGILGGFSNTPFHWKSHRGKGHMTTADLGLYGTWMDKSGFYVDTQLIGGRNRFKSRRNLSFGSIQRVARAHHSAFQLSTDGEIGYAIPLEAITIQPFLNLDYIVVHQRRFKEHGAGSLNLAIKSQTAHFLQGELGATLYHTYVVDGTLIRPAVQLGWVQKRPLDHKNRIKGGLVGQPQTLVVNGDNRVRNQLAPAASLTAQFPNGVNIVANVGAELLSGQSTGEAMFRVGYDF